METKLYSAGFNMPGYLPMADEPALFTSFEDAKRYLIDEMERSADGYCDWVYGSPEHADGSYVNDPIMMADLEKADDIAAAQQDLNLETGPEYGTIAGDLSWWIVEIDRSEVEPVFDPRVVPSHEQTPPNTDGEHAEVPQ